MCLPNNVPAAGGAGGVVGDIERKTVVPSTIRFGKVSTIKCADVLRYKYQSILLVSILRSVALDILDSIRRRETSPSR